jgi:hypothetical protein
VQVTDKNRAPTVSIRLPQGGNHSAGAQIPLFAEAADLDSDTLTFSWSFGGILQPQTGQSINVSFTSAGDYTARVTVTDGRASASATVILHVNFTLPPPPPPDDNNNTPPNPTPGPDAMVAAVAIAGVGALMAIYRRRRV